MRTFLTKSLILIGIVSAIFFSLIFFVPQAKTHYLYEQKIKNERLDTLTGPRLILVGGSNVAFGIESPVLHDSLAINVHNSALHASMGLRFILSQVSTRLRPNDIIIIMPEYQHFYSSAYGQNETLTQAIMYAGISSIKQLNWSQFETFISGIPQATISNLRILRHPLRKDEIYSTYSFNKFGDVVAHYGKGSKPFKVMTISGDLNEDYINDLHSEIENLRKAGHIVYVFPPVMVRSGYENNKEKIHNLEVALKAKGIGFEVAPTEMLQPDSLAFDTPYHMSYPAVHDNTMRLLHFLKQRGVGFSK